MPSGPERRGLEQLLSWTGWEAAESGPAFGEAAGGRLSRKGRCGQMVGSLTPLTPAPWARGGLAGPSARGIISLTSVSQVLAWEGGRENWGSLVPAVICSVNMNMNVSIILTSGKPASRVCETLEESLGLRLWLCICQESLGQPVSLPSVTAGSSPFTPQLVLAFCCVAVRVVR